MRGRRRRSAGAWTSWKHASQRCEEQEELAQIRPGLDGNQVMQFLAVSPGHVVGEALEFLLELRLEEGPMSEDESYAAASPSGHASEASKRA